MPHIHPTILISAQKRTKNQRQIGADNILQKKTEKHTLQQYIHAGDEQHHNKYKFNIHQFREEFCHDEAWHTLHQFLFQKVFYWLCLKHTQPTTKHSARYEGNKTSASVLWHYWLGVRKSIRPVKIEWWHVGVVICLQHGADCLHMVQLMPLHPKIPSSLASFKSIQTGFTFLVQAHPGCPRKEAVKQA